LYPTQLLFQSSRKGHYKIRLNERFLVPNTSASLQIASAAEANLVEGQCLLEEQTLNNERALIY
jgi:hypothetical protein